MSKSSSIAVATAVSVVLIGGVVFEIVTTQPVRGGMRTLSELFTIANRPDLTADERLNAARSLCSARYLQAHPLVVAAEGGLVGLPRNINKNFKAWREGPNVWICPTNRIGPVYQFVFENNGWRFDGPVAILRPWGEIVRTSELPEFEPH
jgi:hypothetical protein